MQPLDINLATSPFRNNTLLWTACAAAVLLLGAFSFWNVSTYREHRAMLRDLRDEVGTFQSQQLDLETRARRAQASIGKFDLEGLRIQSEKANEVINWKAFSWTQLFNQMEQIQPNGVRMNSIRPIFRAERRRGTRGREEEAEGMPVSVEGTARKFAGFAELEQLLHRDPHFGRVEPNRVNRAQNGEIIFELTFMYLPAATAADPATAADEARQASEPVDSVTVDAERANGDGEPAAAGGEPAEAETAEVREPWPGAVAADAAGVQTTEAPRGTDGEQP